MKKFLFLFGAFIAVISVNFSYGGQIEVKKKGKGSGGYDKVHEAHDGKGNSSLSCWDPGNESCGWSTPPGGNGIYQVAVQYVEGQITADVNEGQTVIDGYNIEWNGLDLGNYTMVIQW